MIWTPKKCVRLPLVCAALSVYLLSCSTNEDNLDQPFNAGNGAAGVARAALTEEGLVVRLVPNQIGSNGATWTDPTRGIVFTAGPGAAQPQLISPGFAGPPALRFSGAQYMTASLGDTADWQGFTVIAVVKTPLVPPTQGTMLGSGGPAGYSAPTTGIQWGLRLGSKDGDSTGMSTAGTVPANTPLIITWSRPKTNANWVVRRNGSIVDVRLGLDTTFPTGIFRAYLGAEGVLNSLPQLGGSFDISELLVYKRQLSQADARQAEEDLAGTYGLQLDNEPVIASSVPWDSISSGGNHGCGIRQGGLYCWGENQAGQLGTGSRESSARPRRVGEATDWSFVSAGSDYTCAIRVGRLYCWGSNGAGKSGHPTNFAPFAPRRVGADVGWSFVSANLNHSCGIRNGSLYCWGSNSDGQLGNGTQVYSSTPVQVGVATGWTVVHVGNESTCGIRSGELYCWGKNGGQFGVPDRDRRVTPLRLDSAHTDYQQVATAVGLTLAIRNGELYRAPAPNGAQTIARYGTLANWSAIQLGGYAGVTQCGIESGRLLCWGNNDYGAVGNGTTTNVNDPLVIGTFTDWTQVTATRTNQYAAICGLRGGARYCWGSNRVLGFGDGTNADSWVPLQIADPTPEALPQGPTTLLEYFDFRVDAAQDATVWEDESLSGARFLAPSNGLGPTFVPAAVNGHPALRFGGATALNYMRASLGNASAWSGITIAAVVQPQAALTSDGAFLGTGTGNAAVIFSDDPSLDVGWAWRVGTHASCGLGSWIDPAAAAQCMGSGTGITAATPYVMTWTRGASGGPWTARRNGYPVTTSAVTDSTWPSSELHLFLGGEGLDLDASGNDIWNGSRFDIAHLRIYPRQLGSGELGTVSSQLGGAYGITTATPTLIANGQGPCLANADCAAGLTCGFGIGPRFGRPATEGVCWNASACAGLPAHDCGHVGDLCGQSCCTSDCEAAGTMDVCGGTCPACRPGADSDRDGLLDCDEREDDDEWTDPLIFNGFEAERGNSCDTSPTCDQIDSLAALDQCFVSLEHGSLHRGWSFSTNDQTSCAAGFGFEPNWAGCNSDFAVKARGMVRLAVSGQHCFSLVGSTNQQCAALFVDGGGGITTNQGATCFDLAAGVYPIGWFYETTSDAANALTIAYCYGGDEACLPTQALPSSMLRMGTDRTSRVCGPDLECNELCPCDIGEVCFGDRTCLPGLECRLNVADRFAQPSDAYVCWDPTCENQSSPSYQCGSVDARCGLCRECTPACAGKDCGPDGCGGICGDTCAAREAGCQSDLDCEQGLVCGVDNGARFGLSSSHRVCWPQVCDSLDPASIPCGTMLDPCGTCPACQPNCEDRSCDDGCGGACSHCLGSAYCQQTSGACYAPLIARFPLPADVEVTTAPVGTLDGSFSVTSSGEARYSIPLPTPPGRGGIEPKLSLEYNSSKGNGHVGVGWSLEGLSAITRCNKTIAQDGGASVPTFSAVSVLHQDAFCLDGQRLVVEGLGFNADQTEVIAYYRTENDRFTRITTAFPIKNTIFEEVIVAGPRSFTAYAKDGRVFEYGTTESSRITQPIKILTDGGTPSPEEVQTWALADVRDRTGFNQMHIQYIHRFQQTADGRVREYYPHSIAYGPRQDAIVIRFMYNSEFLVKRSDPMNGWRYGVNLQTNELLRRVRVELGNATAQEYQLEYVAPEEGGGTHTRLATVTRCAGDGACMPPTRFEYDVPDLELRSGPLLGTEAIASSLHALDMNGDGIDDVLYAKKVIHDDNFASSEDKTAWRVEMSTRDGATISHHIMATDQTIEHWTVDFPNDWDIFYAGTPAGEVLDYDGDGRDDLIEYDYDTCNGADADCGSKEAYRILYFDGQAVQRFNTLIPHARSGLDKYRGVFYPKGNQFLLDVDGDRFKDLLICDWTEDSGSSWRLYRHHHSARTQGRQLSTGNFAGFMESDREDLQIDVPCRRGQLLDRDGDGAEELLFPAHLDGSGVATWLLFAADGTPSFAPSNADLFVDASATTLGESTVLDVNGDGLRDLVSIKDVDDSWDLVIQVSRGNGFFDLKHQYQPKSGRWAKLPGRVFAYDANGDGREDLVVNPRGKDGPGGNWFAWLSTGSGFSGIRDLGADTPTLTNGSVLAADFDGDGVNGLLAGEVDAGLGFHIREPLGPPRLLLKTVTDGLGASTSVRYGRLTDPSVYKSDLLSATGAANCSYPFRCGAPRDSVVTRLDEYDALNQPPLVTSHATRRYHYTYEDARTDALGRGFLGFKKFTWRQVDLQTGNDIRSHETVFDNRTREDDIGAYPYAFMPKHIEHITYVDGVKYSELTDIDNDLERRQGPYSPHAFSAYPKKTTQSIQSFDPLREAFDLLSTTVREVLERDTYGNDLRVLTTYGNGDTLLVERDFKHLQPGSNAFRDNWLISLPSLEVVESMTANPFLVARREVTSDYFETGLLEHTTRAPGDPTNELTSTYERNLAGQIEKITRTDHQGRARVTSISYDDLSEYPAKVTNALEQETELEYERVFGRITAVRDPNHLLNQVAIDGFGRTAVTVAPNGVRTTSVWSKESNARPLAVETMQEGGARHRSTYDVRGRLRKLKTWGLDGKELSEEFTYDAQGRLASRTRPTDATETPILMAEYTYDNLGRIATQRVSQSKASKACHSIRASCITDARDFTRCVERDLNGRIVKALDPVMMDCEASLALVSSRTGTSYRYGPFGDLVGVTDFNGSTTTIFMDAWGHKVVQGDPDLGIRTLGYDGFGDLVSESTPSGDTEYDYDDLGRLVQRRDLNFSGPGQDAVTAWTWDGGTTPQPTDGALIGVVTQTQSPDGVTQHFAYDPTTGLLERTTKEINGISYVVQYTRDRFGRIEEIHYPHASGLDEMIIVNTYDDYGHVKRINRLDTPVPYWTAAETDAHGQLSLETFGDATWDAYSYDDHGHTDTKTVGAGLSEILQSVKYGYDPSGNLNSREDLLNAQYEFFDYDESDRLTYDSFGAEIVDYDEIGNIKPSESFAYNLPQPHALAFDGEFTYRYDGSGNRIRKEKANFVERLSFTRFGKPNRIWREDVEATPTNVTILRYDAAQQRAFKSDDTGTIAYVQDLYERRTTASGVAHVYYVSNGNRVVAQVTVRSGQSESVKYLHTDPLGSTTLVTDVGGSSEFEYAPFGENRRPDWAAGAAPRPGSTGVTIGFTSHEQDDALGLVNMRGRLYDPHTRQFISPDPYVQFPFLSTGLNRYAYVIGSPLNLVDPSGYQAAPAASDAGDVVDGDPLPEMVVTAKRLPPTADDTAVVGNVIVDSPPEADTPLGAVGIEGPTARPTAQGAQADGRPSMPVPFVMPEQLLLEREVENELLDMAAPIVVGGGALAWEWLLFLAAYYPEVATVSTAAVRLTCPECGPSQLAQTASRALPQAGKTVLGQSPEYIEKATELGARRFDIPTNIREKMSLAEQWAANQKFLDRAIARGDDIVLATRAGAARAGSFFARELEYLASKGYRVAEDGWSLIAPAR